MLAFPAVTKIYVALEVIDMREQYDGLWAAAQEKLGKDLKHGAVLYFANRERTLLKLLYWDGTRRASTAGAEPRFVDVTVDLKINQPLRREVLNDVAN